MKLLAISDHYIPSEFMQQGFSSLADLGVEVEVRRWEHPTLVDLQEANLAIEQGGPDAVTLPREVTDDVGGFDIVCMQFTPLASSFIQAAENLKVIGVLRGGTENVAVDFATERGIAVLNTPGRNARAVAECALGLILSEVRNIARSHATLKAGIWSRDYPNRAAIPELNEKTVGLVGYGSVGRLLAGYLQAMGSRIIAYDPFVVGDTAPAEMVDLDTLMRESDVISIHARLTAETQHLIGEQQLRLMKPTAVLVNTARSGLIDEQALVRVLQERAIMGAALDVFDVEPLPADHALLELDNVTIVPHISGSTIDAFRNSPKMMAGHLRRMLQGQSPLPIVNGIEPTLRV
ncbi:MAG: 2-hydroxyacid dehydrogenase [Planctomycetes bacterium]|nr:2-hydroxyacid dehydrogenase [Planctomycetota bacterium]MBL7043365.1 2-hydroxyacid dehydrogenase [Pirellulaceae bacterium]